ncbi:hypothetical protein AGMMS49965_04740 [Bacteroidia bacterium]|nr:hypothetical protein AGMMS49965_04740 [Bacteroidia bacterium]
MLEEEMRVTGISLIDPYTGELVPTLRLPLLRAGEGADVRAIVTPSNAANPGINWSTDNEYIATVTAVSQEVISGTGVVFNARVDTRGEGTAKITATTIDGTKVATAIVNVYATTYSGKPTIAANFPQYATYEQGDPAEPLVVEATSPDGGILRYQWYGKKNPVTDPTPGDGDAIPGATNATYIPSTAELGTTRYRVLVTNSNSSFDVSTTAQSEEFIDVTVTPSTKVTDAAPPTITVHPQDTTYMAEATPKPLTVEATSPDGGTLSYLWYRNTENSTTGGTPIVPPATSETLTPPTFPLGTYYYYAVVTNTNGAVNGTKTAMDTTRVARIEIAPVGTFINAEKPEIIVAPQDTFYVLGATPKPLTVEATVTDGGTLSYQWYSNLTDSNTEGTLLDGKTESILTYTLPTQKTWYYVVVTNTKADATGNKTASDTSRAAAIDIVASAKPPTIKTHPASKTYKQGDLTGLVALTVEATSPDGGTLSFEWFQNTTDSKTGGTSVATTSSTETTSSHRPAIDKAVDYFYYVEVTNTLGSAQPATVASNTAKITITPSVPPVGNAEEPKIEELDQDTTYQQGEVPKPLTVKATVTDGGDLTYEWWRTTGGKSVGSAPDCDPLTTTVGTTYYYVEVTNNNNNNKNTVRSKPYCITVTYRDEVWKKVTEVGPFDNNSAHIRGVAAGGTQSEGSYKFVAVGVSGKMASSTDGETWEEVADSKFGTSDINGIVSQGNRWVAVGNSGKMASSTNGETWTAMADSKFGSAGIRSIAIQSSGGALVAVGDDGKMAWSAGVNTTDNTYTWEAVADSKFGTSTIRGIAHGDDKWVAVGDGGKIAYSKDTEDVQTWTLVTVGSFSGGSINSVAYGDGKWLAVGNSGKMASSEDGETWTEVPEVSAIFGSNHINSITYGDNKWVAVGNDGKMAYYSTNPADTNKNKWIEIITDSQFGALSRNIYGVAFGYIQAPNHPKQWVAAGQAGKMAHGNGNW